MTDPLSAFEHAIASGDDAELRRLAPAILRLARGPARSEEEIGLETVEALTAKAFPCLSRDEVRQVVLGALADIK